MKPSEQLQSDVVEELAYDPEVDSSSIAATTAENGVVTLSGSVPTYTELRAAEHAVRRLAGVKAVANDLVVSLGPATRRRNDTEIAGAALDALRWSAAVRSLAEKAAAERAAWSAPGVSSVANEIEVRSPAYV